MKLSLVVVIVVLVMPFVLGEVEFFCEKDSECLLFTGEDVSCEESVCCSVEKVLAPEENDWKTGVLGRVVFEGKFDYGKKSFFNWLLYAK